MLTWAKIALSVLALLRWITEKWSAEESKQAGRDEANLSIEKQKTEKLEEAKKAEEYAEKQQQAKPDSDDAFDNTFRRD